MIKRLECALTGKQENNIKEDTIKKLQLTYATLLESTTLLTKSHYNEKVVRPPLYIEEIYKEDNDTGWFGLGGGMMQ